MGDGCSVAAAGQTFQRERSAACSLASASAASPRCLSCSRDLSSTGKAAAGLAQQPRAVQLRQASAAQIHHATGAQGTDDLVHSLAPHWGRTFELTAQQVGFQAQHLVRHQRCGGEVDVAQGLPAGDKHSPCAHVHLGQAVLQTGAGVWGQAL